MIKTAKHKIKLITGAVAFSTSLAWSIVGFADAKGTVPATGGADQGSSAVVAAINNLGKRIEAIAIAGVKTINDAAYQIDQNLPSLMQINTQQNTISSQVVQQTNTQTQDEIKNSLQEISDSVLTYNVVTPEVEKSLDRIIKRGNKINDLTLNTPSSDTLYTALSDAGGTALQNNGYSVSKPSVLHDNYFDFSSLISPEAYSPEQRVGANNFIDLITKRYEPLTANIDFENLKANLDTLKSHPKELASTLHNFRASAPFKNYQLAIRSVLATQSIALNNYNKLVTERTPLMRKIENPSKDPDPTLAAISQTVGVTPKKVKIEDPKNPDKMIDVMVYASPLQIENYVANHRVSNQKWYQQVANASPASVQRETLYVLAEMQSQMHQAHIDNEKLLATMTALQVQMASAGQTMLRTNANDLNTAIAEITKPKDNNSATSASANAAAEYDKKFNQSGSNPQKDTNNTNNMNNPNNPNNPSDKNINSDKNQYTDKDKKK